MGRLPGPPIQSDLRVAMARAFTAADAAQSVPGTAAAVSTPGATLAETVAGRGGVIVIGAGTGLDAPEQWHRVAKGGQSAAFPQCTILCRANLLGGETSWAFASAGGTTNWAWVAEEWTNLSYAPLAVPGVDNTPGGFQPASVTLGPTDTWTGIPYVMAVAAIAILHGTAGGGTWPTVTWSDGFTETDVLSVGNNSTNGPAGSGPNSNDMQLRVARRYGTLDEAGGWQTTATFSGQAMTNKSVYGALAVFRAENYVGEA